MDTVVSESHRYPFAGAANPHVRLAVVDVSNVVGGAGAADGANAKGSKDKAPDVGEKRKRTKFTATQQVFGLLSCSRKSLTKAT